MQRGNLRGAAVAAVMVAAALGLAACGGGGGTSSAGGSSSADDIIVGLANTEGQTISIPDYRYGALAAVNYINAQGGINGHQLKVVTCLDDGSPAGSVNCANKFVAAHASVYFAGIDVGGDSAVPILRSAGIPYVTEFPVGPVTQTSRDVFALGGGTSTIFIGSLQSLKDAGVSSVGLFYYNIPQTQQLLPVFKGLATGLGLKLTAIPVSATNADWSSAVATAQANHVSSLWGLIQDGDCTNMVRSARTAGFSGPIAVGTCSSYVSALGSEASNTLSVWPYYFPQLASEAPTSVQSQLKVYEKYMQAAGYGKYQNGFAVEAFASLVELSEVMKGIKGTVTSASLLAALKTAVVPGFLGPSIDCAAHVYTSEPTACEGEALLLKVVSTPGGEAYRLLQPGYDNTAKEADRLLTGAS